MERTVKTPGPDHPVTVEPAASRVVVRAGGTVVADTTRALTLRESTYPPVRYIPIEDVDRSALTPSDSRTHCPYKGEASYYSLTTPDGTVDDAVWTYAEPYDAVRALAGHVAFYPQHVEIAEA